MTTGEGGMVCTNSLRLAERVRLLKNQGQSPTRRYYHPVLGYNYRMTNITAAIGLAQVESIGKFIAKKRALRAWYEEDLEDLQRHGLIRFQKDTALSRPSYWMIALTLASAKPKDVARRLEKHGIETRPFFVPMHRLPYINDRGSYSRAEKLSKTGIILPSALTLTRKDVTLACTQLRRALKK